MECAWQCERIIPQKQHELYAPLSLWLISRPEPTPGEKIVYARLAFYAGNHGEARASLATIADAVGISKPQIIAILRSLSNRHLIEAGGKGRMGVQKYFFLRHPWMNEQTEGKETLPLEVKSVGDSSKESSPEKRYEKRIENESYVGTAPPVPAANNENESGGASIVELERKAKQAGANIEREKQAWRKQSERKGWSQDEAGWMRWLVNLIKRKPMPSKPVNANAPCKPAPPQMSKEETDRLMEKGSLTMKKFLQEKGDNGHDPPR